MYFKKHAHFSLYKKCWEKCVLKDSKSLFDLVAIKVVQLNLIHIKNSNWQLNSKTTSSSAIHHTWLKLPPLLPHHLVIRLWFPLRRKSEHVCPSGKKATPFNPFRKKVPKTLSNSRNRCHHRVHRKAAVPRKTQPTFFVLLSMLVDVFRMLPCLNPANIFASSMKWHTTPTHLGTHTHFRCWGKLFLFYIFLGNQYFPGGFSFFWVDESSQTATCHDFPVHLSPISLTRSAWYFPRVSLNICFSCCADDATRDYLVSASNRKDKYPQLESITQCATCQNVSLSTRFLPLGFRSTKLQLCSTVHKRPNVCYQHQHKQKEKLFRSVRGWREANC